MKVKKIDKDEKHDLEFKQSWRDEYLKWICAFANTHGGSLYIGVKDNGEICGVKDYRKLSEDIPNKILQAMGLICEVNLLDEGGCHVLSPGSRKVGHVRLYKNWVLRR